jgi:hypothetical protein
METGKKAIDRLVTKMLYLTILVDGEKEQRAQRGRVCANHVQSFDAVIKVEFC